MSSIDARKLTLTSIAVMAAAQALPSKATQFLNTGDSDASPDSLPSQFLLLRGLEPTVTEELLAKGVAKLYKSGRGSTPPPATHPKKGGAKVASTTSDSNLGAKEGSLMRVLLVRDRRTNESWRYGFAEFATVEVILPTLVSTFSAKFNLGRSSSSDQVQLPREVHNFL